MIRLFIIIWPIWFILLSGCSTDPNEKANELYVKASMLMQSVRTEAESYSRVLESYKSAQKTIERILSNYASSNVAVRLLSGEARISGFALNEFQKLGSFLKPLAEAEQKPLSCALLVAKTIKRESFKASALAKIAGKYAEAGQKEKAAQILSQALKTAKTIEYELSKALALADIVGNYAEAGQFTQALKTAKTIEDESSKASALADIAGKYAEAGQQPSEKDMAELRDIVHTTHPISLL